MYAILSFSCELILLDQFYIGFKSFSLGIFVYAIDLLWESKFALSILMYSIVINLNPVFLLVLPLFLFYIVQNYIFTFGPKRKLLLKTSLIFHLITVILKRVYSKINPTQGYSALVFLLEPFQHLGFPSSASFSHRMEPHVLYQLLNKCTLQHGSQRCRS